MENERYNYIILDDEGATWDATNYKASWRIPFHYYTEYENNDDVYIELENCVFTGSTTVHTSNTCTIFMEDVLPINQSNTDIRTILGIIPCKSLPDNPTSPINYYVSPSNVDCNNMKLKVNRFEKITLYVDFENETENLFGDPYRFILKVSYKKKN
mmetsp:Transcript_34107/g.40109  ORF Transcript_34107/g.40109 Transcript_34107/m.40109 type:complete len:156 (+) Transcript_34107:314-781(+)